jgi:hypothetical protein
MSRESRTLNVRGRASLCAFKWCLFLPAHAVQLFVDTFKYVGGHQVRILIVRACMTVRARAYVMCGYCLYPSGAQGGENSLWNNTEE